MGNRGILHDGARQIVRAWQVRRWIACRTEFHGRQRRVMQPHLYTELFFLDEATALAAGHRPCAECRYADYQRFRSLWVTRHGGPVRADRIDDVLHAERLIGNRKRTYREDAGTLPDGTYVERNARAWLLWKSELLAWSMSGYLERIPLPLHQTLDVLTPRSTVDIIRDGYRPSVHPSAGT